MASPYGMFAPGASISERPRSYKYDDDVTTSMPDWIENPSEGFRVVTGRGRDESSAMRDATSGAMGASPSDTHVQKEGNEFIAYALVEEAVPGAAEGGMLSTYESPALELDEDEGRGGIRARLASEAERDALARQIATGGVEEAGQSSLEEQIAEVSAPARPFFQEGRDISIQPSPAGVDRTPAFSEAISSATSADEQIANQYIAEIKKDPTARNPTVNGLTIQQQPNAAAVQALVSKYTNSLDFDRSVTAFQQQQRRGRDDYSGPVAQRQLSVDPRQGEGQYKSWGAQDAAPDDEGGLLQMLAGLGGDIGGWAKENPELIMAGLQTIGELGGQYKRGRREQEASDAEAQERRMSGAISALTRGRVTPEVGRRAPRTTAGEGMFDVMAGIGRGGTQFLEAKRGREEREEALEMYREDREIAAGERTRERDWAEEDRRRAEEDRTRTRDWAEEDREIAAGERTYERTQAEQDRKDAFEERLAALDLSEEEKEEERRRYEEGQTLKGREVTVKEREVAVKEAEQAEDSVPKIDTVSTADARVIAEGINAMIDIFDSGWPSETGTLAPERTYGVSAGIQSEFDGIKTALIGRMKKFQELDRLSNMDYQIILDSLPDRGKSSGWNEGKRRGIFRALEIASEGQWKAPPIPSFWDRIGGWGEDDEATEGGGAEAGAGTAEAEQIMKKIRALAEAGKDVPEELLERARGAGITIPGLF